MSRNSLATLELIRQEVPVIAPSMLKCDYGNLQRDIQLLDDAGTRLYHLDVMDGHFVPNLSYGPMVIERMRECTDVTFDCHLMISNPEKYIGEYVKVGCDWLTIHIEAVPQPQDVLKQIRDAGCGAGIALNPGTPVSALAPAVGLCDVVLIMSVEPGFGGQKFQPAALEKVAQIRELFGPEVLISIDGGIGPDTIQAAAAAGVQLFVAGSSVFDQPCYESAISNMRSMAQSVMPSL
ncbi:MAG: ribulose-phosphate 3-epimerase [Planctomycetaceae bacterium]|nr:ribulose-phosphate 3-epimerase [Planctomycetaceae bacterium]MCA9043019.1 ribulose-phosphate 3-epimerase [Planctomycetaceae bacterium]MCB9950407.1 ribulose-phosphate 3-epimerase [Planctomycetaceae bacterium]